MDCPTQCWIEFLSACVILEAMEALRNKDVQDWTARHIGKTVQAGRKEFYQATSSQSSAPVELKVGAETENLSIEEIEGVSA